MPRVVRMSFRPNVFRKGNRYFGVGDPVLTIELLGSQNLQLAAKALFKFYLGDILQESLSAHIWRFETVQNDSLAFSSRLPILSDAMSASEPYDMGFEDPIHCPLGEGSEMVFFYDEGSTTRVFVKIEGIYEVPDAEESAYPRRAPTTLTAGVTAVAVPTHPLDASVYPLDKAFPSLTQRSMSGRYTAFFGPCAKELHGAIGGGPTDNGDPLYAPLPFETLEDYLICANEAWPKIGQEMSDGFTRDGWVNLIVFPPETQEPDDEKKFASMKHTLDRIERFERENTSGLLTFEYPGPDKPTKHEQFMMCGPKEILCRLTLAERDAARATLREQGFDVAQLFPTLHEAFRKGSGQKFWFKAHQNGKLLLASGMVKAKSERSAHKVLAESATVFQSLHQLFEAAEAALKDVTTSKKRKRNSS